MKNAAVMQVTATQPDPSDAAAIVNAVVDAYMNEVVNGDRQARRIRLSDLQKIYAEKENEVRTKREQLKRELENHGVGDDQQMLLRAQLAQSMYAEFEREYQSMRGTPVPFRQTPGSEEGLVGHTATPRSPRPR